MPVKLYIAVPCYNEEEVLPDSAAKLSAKLRSMMDIGTISCDSRIVFIDDGSKDATWEPYTRSARVRQHFQRDQAQPQPRSPERPDVRADDPEG